MNATILESTKLENRTEVRHKAVVRVHPASRVTGNFQLDDEARWKARALELAAIFDDESLPTTTGKLGSFLL